MEQKEKEKVVASCQNCGVKDILLACTKVANGLVCGKKFHLKCAGTIYY